MKSIIRAFFYDSQVSRFSTITIGVPATFPIKKALFAVISVLVFITVGCQSNETVPETPPGEPAEVAPEATGMDNADETPAERPTSELNETPTAIALPTETVIPEQVRYMNLLETECPFNKAAFSREVLCYRLTVPEDHNSPDNGRTIELPVAIFKSDSPTPAADPILYLSGGPGENALQTAELNFSILFEPYLATRDLIMFDQRGTGGSTPALNCPEIKAYILEYLDDDLDLETTAELALDSYRRCYERLSKEGVNFSVYNSAQNAADVAMLREALGYPEWNLLAASYGTRLAQTILRDNDTGVRSVILDSVYPVEVNIQTETPANLQRAMDIFFAGCNADEICSTVYPDLETVFWDLVAEYNEAPFLLTATDLFTRETYETLIYGDTLIQELFRSLYSPELTSMFPRMLFNLRDGNTDLLASFTSRSLSLIDFVSVGMQITVQCREEIFFTNPDEAAAVVAEHEEFGSMFVNGSMTGLLGLEICEIWETGTPPLIENEAVSSDVPTLIIHGELDPITPPSWGRQVAERFGNAYFFEYPAQGHGPGFTSACARTMALEFIDNPLVQPDSSCISNMGEMAYAVPVAAETISLAPYASELFGISGLIPEDWTEAGPGIYSKWGNLILQQAVPGMSSRRLAFQLISQLGLDTLPEPVGEVETNGLIWTVYQFNNSVPGQGKFEFDMALAEANGVVYLVFLQSTPEDYPGLHEGVFIPVLQSLTVP